MNNIDYQFFVHFRLCEKICITAEDEESILLSMTNGSTINNKALAFTAPLRESIFDYAKTQSCEGKYYYQMLLQLFYTHKTSVLFVSLW
jgi:hypothetical protein